MYAYYFEKDKSNDGGHTNDWEHVIVYAPDVVEPENDAMIVCVSAHKEYLCLQGREVRWYGRYHPKVVYNQDGVQTHVFRHAGPSDDNVENHSGQWRLGDLISFNGFPTVALRDKLFAHNFDAASLAIRDGKFEENLLKPRLNCPGCGTALVPRVDFDVTKDENGSPGELAAGDTCAPLPSIPYKYMIIGDSITQGFEGDYTWRFRLSQWMTDQRLSFTFVGPWTGTHTGAEPSDPKPPRVFGSGPEPPGPPRTEGLYASGAPPIQPHWALWGRQAAQVRPEIRSQVQAHSPDILLIMLGFNDLGWWVSDASGLLDTMKGIVDEARSANPNIRLFIANVIQRTAIGGREDLPPSIDDYNRKLRDAIPTWTQPGSVVRLVDVQPGYSCGPSIACPAAYDGLHPGPQGEYEIARSFSDALVAAKIARAPLSMPAEMPPGKEPGTPGSLEVTPAPWGIKIRWNRAFGMPGYQLQWRQKGGTWEGWPEGISWGINGWDNSWVLKGQEWEYQVRSAVGNKVSAWSDTSSAVANPSNPSGPKNVWSEPRGNSIFLKWDAVPGATSYEVMFSDQDGTGVVFPVSGSALGTSVTINEGLVVGHRYAIAVITWVSSGPGWPSVANAVRIGSGQPAAVTNLRVVNVDPTTVTLTWTASAGAASYRVWSRNYKTGGAFKADEYATTSGTSHGVAFLFPGTWNFEFYVVPQNGNLLGGMSNTVIPPVYPGFGKRSVISEPSQRNPLLAGMGTTPIAMWGPPVSFANGPRPVIDLNISPS